MGGRVFKEHFNGEESLKMDRETYFNNRQKISDFFLDWIREVENDNDIFYTEGYFMFPNEFINKESFGDIDVIVCKNSENLYIDSESLQERIKKYFGEDSIIKTNGPIVHFLYQNKYQVDFILTDFYDMPIKHFYLSYSIGMLLGIIARHMGVAFGMEGLKIRNSDILIKSDSLYGFSDYKVFEFFQLDENQYKNIKTEEDAFKFVWSCPFATHEVFKSSLANCKHRKREADSKVFKRFFEWLESQPEKSKDEIKYIPTTKHEQNYYLRSIFGDYTIDNVEKEIAWLNYKNSIIKDREQDHYNFSKFVIAFYHTDREFAKI